MHALNAAIKRVLDEHRRAIVEEETRAMEAIVEIRMKHAVEQAVLALQEWPKD